MNRTSDPTPEPAATAPEFPPETPEAEVVRLRAEVARLEQQVAALEILADRDPLTTIFNRRAFMRELNRVVGFCERYQTTAAVVFFDMDAFKGINDVFGHAAGDAALQAVAATLASHVRESDVVGRLGGDEFAVILVQVDRSAAQAKADSLKQRIEASPAIHDGMAVPLRVSHGLRMFEPGITAAGLLAGADAAMFLNKPPTR